MHRLELPDFDTPTNNRQYTPPTDSLIPTSWDEYIGQEKLKEYIKIQIKAALKLNEPMDHVLLLAHAGAGKSSLARIIHSELNENSNLDFVVVTKPPTMTDLAQIVETTIGVLFLDEIHRWTPKQQEELLPLLEHGYVERSGGKRSQSPWLTVIAATTERHKLIEPLVDRFPHRPVFAEYSNEEIATIIKMMAKKMDLHLDDTVRASLAPACGGTPRRARTFIIAARNLEAANDRPPTVEEILDFCEVAQDGLTQEDFTYMRAVDAFGGAVGLDKIAMLLRMSKPAVEAMERNLFKSGYLEFSGRGRRLTGRARLRLRAEEQGGPVKRMYTRLENSQ